MRRRFGILVALSVASGALFVAACGAGVDDAWIWSPRPSAGSVSVPDVVGLSESEAVKELGAAGLAANVRYASDAPRTGKVLHSYPEAGRELPADSVIVLSIALEPRLPTPGPEDETDIAPLGRLVEDHPEVFVGLYRDGAGVPHVVFGPGADPETWAERLEAAAKQLHYPKEGIGYRADMCSHNLKSLRAIQDEITTKWWTKNAHLAFGVWVQPETCTARVGSDLLTPDEIEALVGRYGTAISFDTTEGSHPVLLPSID